jgi:hypothetical protein
MDNNGWGSRLIRFEQDANYNILRNNEIYNGRVDGIALCCGRNVGNVIESNHIHHFDAGDIDAHGIVLEPGSDDTVIQGNVIHDSSGDAIQIYAVNTTPVSDYSKNVRIMDNVLYRGALARSENALDFKGADGLVVSGNELSGYALPAVVIQMGSRNLVFDNNIIHDSSYGVVAQGGGGKHSENITLRNNLFYRIGTHAILFTDVYGAIAHYNTIAYAAGGSFRIGGSGLLGGDIRNNLVYQSGKALVGSGVPFINVTVGYNAWFDAASGITAPTDIAGSGDPGFVDAANGDYHLTAGSRARDAGIDVSVTADFENDARPFGNRTDIGADEYWPSLRLSAIPQDGKLRLVWTQYDDPALTSYVITYSYGVGGRAASQGASPISGISAATQSYELTGLTNYVLYTITLTARDGSGSELIESNSARVMPSDIFVYLPAMMKNSR